MGAMRQLCAVVAVAGALTACGGGGDDGEAADATTVPAATAPTTTAAAPAGTGPATTTSGGGTVAETAAVPRTTVAPTSAAPASDVATTIDESSSGEPTRVPACTLLATSDIEEVLGAAVGTTTDLGTSCEWEVGEGTLGVPDTLSLTIEGGADGLADTRELLGESGVDVPQAGEGGVYWTDFTTLYFAKDGRQLALQYLATGADDPLGTLIELSNRVG